MSAAPITTMPVVRAVETPVSRSSVSLSPHVQGSALIGWVVVLFALLLLATPPLAVLSLAREKPAPAVPTMTVMVSKFA